MAAAGTVSVEWSSQLEVTPPSRTSKALLGDKILLPPSALEQLLSAATTVVLDPETSQPSTSTFDPFNPYSYAAERHARSQYRDTQQQLPHPLTFRLVNPQSGHVVYAGIREFSADEGEVVLSPFLRQALGLDPSQKADPKGTPELNGTAGPETLPRMTVHARQLQRGTFVRLRPLEAGYDPDDWKSLLEQHLRTYFTTLTKGEILTVPNSDGAVFRFLVDKFAPEGADAVCIIDTDLEVDIEPLNEEQARETLQRRLAKSKKAPGSSQNSSTGGKLKLWNGQQGQVLAGDYVDYQLLDWDRRKGVEIELSGVDDGDELDLFVSPFAARQRARPRDDQHVFGDFGSKYPKRLRLEPSNVALEDAEALWLSVHAYIPADLGDREPDVSKPAKGYFLRATPLEPGASDETEGAPAVGDVQCKNCRQWVPERTLFLHENFCFRNNVLCPHCLLVYKKSTPEWESHWHCPHDSSYGDSSASKAKHDHVEHSPFPCPVCAHLSPSLSSLAVHRSTVCPGKLILCQFCHLQVPQEGDPNEPNAEALLSNLTPHELADGARTTECHLCNKIIRLRDMATHLRHHDLERKRRPTPRVCRSVNCGRTVDGVGKNGEIRGGTGSGNELGLCGICYGPLYVSMYDPDGKALRRRVERRYLTQLLSGCGKEWCANEYCRTGRSHRRAGEEPETLGAKEALPMVRPFLETLKEKTSPLHFCVDEASQRRRGLAEMMAGEGGYVQEWCVAALEAEGGDLDRARGWLKNWAPSKAET